MWHGHEPCNHTFYTPLISCYQRRPKDIPQLLLDRNNTITLCNIHIKTITKVCSYEEAMYSNSWTHIKSDAFSHKCVKTDIKEMHLKQGVIRQLSEVFDKCCAKLTIFEPSMWLEQTYGTIFISTVCLPIIQRWHTNVNKLLLLILKCVLRYIQRTKCRPRTWWVVTWIAIGGLWSARHLAGLTEWITLIF